MAYDKLIFELDTPGTCGIVLEEPQGLQLSTGIEERKSIGLPSVSEPEVLRHYVLRSLQNYSRDAGLYPLGSCTMKYNPRINEVIARYPGFAHVHPLQPIETVQGALQLVHELQRVLGQLTGLPAVSLLPAAGAHAELVGLMIIKAHHKYHNNSHRDVILIPDSAHGTNPATATACGYKSISVPSNDRGIIDLQCIKNLMTDNVAGLMITNPNTCGVFEGNISEICDFLRSKGALIYCDGANYNAIVGKVAPADLGIDIMHINLHKTFSTPHGGGGPGGGVICVTEVLRKFLPSPIVEELGGEYSLSFDSPYTVGKISAFHGSFGVMVRALSYILSLGDDIKYVAEHSVLHANYVLNRLKDLYDAPFGDCCMHECLLTDKNQRDIGVTTNEIAKYLIDCGFHPMTVYFPLVVRGAMLIEPTETESKATIDRFIETMRSIAIEVQNGNIAPFIGCPTSSPVARVDETLAARKPVLVYEG